jgi:hypothetical protein
MADPPGIAFLGGFRRREVWRVGVAQVFVGHDLIQAPHNHLYQLRILRPLPAAAKIDFAFTQAFNLTTEQLLCPEKRAGFDGAVGEPSRYMSIFPFPRNLVPIPIRMPFPHAGIHLRRSSGISLCPCRRNSVGCDKLWFLR